MAQEFTIKSQQIENKINQLLPSQGGFQPGVDFSASTMVVPIVDLTESAEGSILRQDLQTSLSLGSVTSHSIINTTSTIQNTPGYWRVFGGISLLANTSNAGGVRFTLTDGISSKIIYENKTIASTTNGQFLEKYDFIVKLEAGELLTGTADTSGSKLIGASRQLADVSGNLVNP